MIIVNQNTKNIIVISSYYTGTTYSLTLVNLTTNEEYSGITLVNDSKYKDRYYLFELTLTGASNQNYLESKINIPNGNYMYYIYADNLLIDKGLFKAEGDEQVIINKYKKDIKYKAYNNKIKTYNKPIKDFDLDPGEQIKP